MLLGVLLVPQAGCDELPRSGGWVVDSGAPDGGAVKDDAGPARDAATRRYSVVSRTFKTSDGIVRTFLLAHPERVEPGLPLVFSFAPDGGDVALLRESMALEAKAKRPTVFVYPIAALDRFASRTAEGRAHEARFVTEVVAQLEQEMGIDTTRVSTTSASAASP
jgi:poly(3-hydroxybutyrate) depolymerase